MDKQETDIQLQRFLYQELVRLSILVDNSLTEPQIFCDVMRLVKRVRYNVNGTTTEQRINQLFDYLYNDEGFHCNAEEYFYTKNLLIDKILTNHCGMPVSLGALILYFASVLDLPIYPVNFPTQLILRADFINDENRQETRFINPWNGQTLSIKELEKWLEGEFGLEAEMSPELTKIADEEELLERLETVFKMALSREGKYEETLKLIQYRLKYSPDDPYEIRDRGMVYANLDCYQAAVDDLNYFY